MAGDARGRAMGYHRAGRRSPGERLDERRGDIPVTPFRQNCSLLWCEDSGRGALVDPGGDIEQLEVVIAEHGVEIEKILVTHGHFDHAGAVAEMAERLDVPIEGPHPDDGFLIENLEKQGAKYGAAYARPFEPGRWLAGGDEVTVGDLAFAVRHCPGHTPGHVIFHQRDAMVAFVGDVLFKGSVGRSDLPRGNHEQLIRAIRSELWPLGDETTFVPCHGPLSTFGNERKTNPYCSDFVEI